MASDLRITDACAKSALNNLFGTSNALVGTQANSGILRIYADAGSPDIPAGEPANAGHGTVLAELTMNATSFGAAAAETTGVKITAGAITQDSAANASGDAKYFTLFASNGTTALIQGTVDVVGNSPDMVIDNVTIAIGATVSCSAFTIKIPKGWTT